MGFEEVYLARTGKLNIVMEYCDGGDLMKKLAERHRANKLWSMDEPVYFAESQVLSWFTMVALAVKHCRDENIIHGDLKSSNIFLCSDGTAKVGDFGMSSILSGGSESVQEIVGTPYYMAPELLEQV